MVQCLRSSLDLAFAALGDPIRREMLRQLARGETSLSQLARPHHISLTAIRKHVRVLERAGFIAHEKRGRVRHVRLTPGRTRKCAGSRRVNFSPLSEVKDWMAQFEAHWDEHLFRLKQQVESDL